MVNTLQFTPPTLPGASNIGLASSTSSSSSKCTNTRNTISNELSILHNATRFGCTKDWECSIQDISVSCGYASCQLPVLTQNSEIIAERLHYLTTQLCTSDFTSTCPNLSRSTTLSTSSLSSSSTTTTQSGLICIPLKAYCNLSSGVGICSSKNKYVALGAEISSAPGTTLGIGTNQAGIDGVMISNGITIATSTIPIPTTDNVNNVISNIPISTILPR